MYVFVVPSVPRLLEIVSVSSTSVTLQWIPPEPPNGVITQYSLNGQTINISNNVLMYTVGGLSPDTMHSLHLRAHTIVGEGPPSSVTVITCKLLNTIICLLFGLCVVFQCQLISLIVANLNQ